MKTLEVKYSTNKTNIYLENNLLENISSLIPRGKKYIILTDENIYKLYSIALNVPNSTWVVLPAGEKEKNLDNVSKIIEKMLSSEISKTDILINFGGGVISDLGGFVASTYKRGINYYNIPTTLISQVDATLGGKTGVDFKVYKNQIGSIHHPEKIFVDPILLNTLPKNEYLSGIGEVIKYGLCFDEDLFNSLFSNFSIDELIYKCLKIKAEITEKDEFDNGIRLALNFGHTIGHAIEAVSNYTIPHGICVIYGMLYEIEAEDIKDKLIRLMQKFEIENQISFDKDELKAFIIQDKKIRNGVIKLPKLEKIGKVKITEVKINDYLMRL